ncbi:hypothetical protein RU10_09290 [Pseudomonas fluorescens]|uniref:Uncharacterized protein n=1 Tax=Pseudomonas fluorescens TaxID=294 RepID=A0AAE2AXH8_PSEFL|nr:hypothetical protein RU10_09290 [Pseudomonas fluorescens]
MVLDDGASSSPAARGVHLERIQTTRQVMLDAPLRETEQLLGGRGWVEVARQQMQATAKTEEGLSW